MLFAGVSGITTPLSFYSFWIATVGVKMRVKRGAGDANALEGVHMTSVESTRERRALMWYEGACGEAGKEAARSGRIVCYWEVAS